MKNQVVDLGFSVVLRNGMWYSYVHKTENSFRIVRTVAQEGYTMYQSAARSQ